MSVKYHHTLSGLVDHYTSVTIITDIVAFVCTVALLHTKNIKQQVRVKKFVPNIKGDIGMEVYYLCQSNTYVIAITAAHKIHEQ